MSVSGNARRSRLLEVAQQLAVRMIAELQSTDLRAYDAHALLTLWFLAVTDVLGLTVQDLQTEVGRFVRSVRGWAWVDVVKVLKSIDNALLHLDAPTDSYTSFKRWCAQQCVTTTTETGRLDLPGSLVSTMFSGIKDRDAHAIKCAHQFFQFPLRGDILTDEARKRLESEGIAKFLECEQRLADVELPADTAWNPFFQKYLGGWDPYDNLVCRISSGSARVNGRSSRRWWEKWCALGCADADYIEYFAGKIFPASSAKCSASVARYFQVPKSSDALRGISIEPAGLAFLQQGLMLSLRRYIRGNAYLHRRFDPMRPELSASLARTGSIDGSFATIDLSDASDSVTLDYLERVAAETDFLEVITMARSKAIELPDGQVISLRKYGGMGNALTFTIESLVFASLIEQGIRDVRGSIPKSRYRVYGDDLVVEEQYFAPVCARLTSAGFRVNTSKSFSAASGSPFREACGGEYFLGVDVKPVRVPRKQFRRIDRRMTADAIQGYIDLANSCYGVLPSVRWAIIAQLRDSLPQHLWPIFTTDGSEGFRSDTATNYHLEVTDLPDSHPARRYLQYTSMCKFGSAKPVLEKCAVDEDVLYEHALLSLAGRDVDDQPLTIAQQLALQSHSETAAHIGDTWGVVRRYF